MSSPSLLLHARILPLGFDDSERFMCLAPSMSSTREERKRKCGKDKCRQIGCASCPQEFSGIKMKNFGLKCIFGKPEFWSQFS